MSNITLTKKELSDAAGYTYRRLYDIDMALPDEKKLFIKGEDGKYDLALFVRHWVQFNVERETENELSLDDVRAKHEQVKTEKTKIEVARLRGQLVDIDEVRKAWGDVANTVMQNMLRLPSKIAPQVLMLDNIQSINGIIDKEIRQVLTDIAETPIAQQTQDASAEDADEEE